MSVYLIAAIEVLDREQYSEYEAGFIAAFSDFPGSILAVEESPQVLEGEWPYTRTVLMRFPDEASARNWYESPQYQELAKLRTAAARTRLVLTRGLRPR